ncbi:MAG: alpha/beta hydrolase [Rikenellaceae bacterium]|nr:alpha/beta hydrolase [Rikenellaceae bacterium]
MIRRYGQYPYTAALIHGGPGAAGSLGCVAKRLGDMGYGILEPFQSGYTIETLVRELESQLRTKARQPIYLVGHSWGAWLSIIFASRHPEAVKSIVAVGCAPFDEKYVSHITTARMKKFTPDDRLMYERLVIEISENCCETNFTKHLLNIIQKVDNHDALHCRECEIADMNFDQRAYNVIWSEATRIRKSGGFAEILAKVQCPIHVIHGYNDPHPYYAVEEYLKECGVDYYSTLLDNCGHYPFHEKACSDKFYEVLKKIFQR